MPTNDSGPDKQTGSRRDSSTDTDFPHEDWVEALKTCARQFDAENGDLEAVLDGSIGFHAFHTGNGETETRGVQTAIYRALYDCLEELHIDDDIVEQNKGEVTPQTVSDEVLDQLEYFGGLYVNDRLEQAVTKRVAEQVRRNQRGAGE
jgi:hypothetical protein